MRSTLLTNRDEWPFFITKLAQSMLDLFFPHQESLTMPRQRRKVLNKHLELSQVPKPDAASSIYP